MKINTDERMEPGFYIGINGSDASLILVDEYVTCSLMGAPDKVVGVDFAERTSLLARLSSITEYIPDFEVGDDVELATWTTSMPGLDDSVRTTIAAKGLPTQFNRLVRLPDDN